MMQSSTQISLPTSCKTFWCRKHINTAVDTNYFQAVLIHRPGAPLFSYDCIPVKLLDPLLSNVRALRSNRRKQVKQCLLTRVPATTVAVEKQCVTYPECVFVALGIRHAMHTCHTVICGLSDSNILSRTVSKNDTILEKKY